MLVIVDNIDISWKQPSYEKDYHHTLVQMIIELKPFLCSILDQEFCYLSSRKWGFGIFKLECCLISFFATFDTLTECVN